MMMMLMMIYSDDDIYMEKEDGSPKHPIQYGEDPKQRRILQSFAFFHIIARTADEHHCIDLNRLEMPMNIMHC